METDYTSDLCITYNHPFHGVILHAYNGAKPTGTRQEIEEYIKDRVAADGYVVILSDIGLHKFSTLDRAKELLNGGKE